MRILFWESQRLGAEVIDLLFIVESLKGREVDALEDSPQGVLFITLLLLNVDDLSDALLEGGFAMVVRLEFHGHKMLMLQK